MISMVDAPILVIKRRSAHIHTSGCFTKNKDNVAKDAKAKPNISISRSPILSEYFPSGKGRMTKGVSIIINMIPISLQVKPRYEFKYIGV